MTDRRISFQKLTKYLRILEDDLILFLMEVGLEATANSKGFVGYRPDEVKNCIASLDTEQIGKLYALKQKWEEVNFHPEIEMEDYLSAEEIGDVLGISPKKVPQFLNANNVPKVRKNSHVFWLVVDIFKIKNKPTKKQASDLNRLRSNKIASTHLNNNELAELFGIPSALVGKYRKVLRIENIYPLTREYVLDLISENNFDLRRDRFLSRQTSKDNEVVATRAAASYRKSERTTKDKLYSSPKAAEILNITPERFRKVVKKLGYVADSTFVNKYKQEINLYSHKTILEMTNHEEFFATRTDPFFNKEKEFESARNNIVANVKENVSINILRRKHNPYFATLYVGPTNSGKTYNALNSLYEEYEENPDGVYVYAAPLRMLAFEVYQKMVIRYGKDNVGFITGEESINADAPLLATTVEMAPTEGNSLVLDEAHWIVEPSRGHKWTRLLLGGEYKSLHILTAVEALTTITELIDDAYDVNVRTFTRKTPIAYRGDISIKDIPNKTVIVCFSRKDVYKTAQTLIAKSGKKVGVLYGALPLIAREQQINDFIDGKTDIIVTTDVIGHGINLPVDNVVFAETTKFDGDIKRGLHLWEAAQIAGRAGRFGLSEQGNVYSIRFDWNDVDKSLLESAALAAGGTIGTNLFVNKALVAPTFRDLNISVAENTMIALEEWERKLSESDEGKQFDGSSMREVKARLESLAKTLKTPVYPWDMVEDRRDYQKGHKFGEGKHFYGDSDKAEKQWAFTASELWNIINGPFEATLPTIGVIGHWLQSGRNPAILEKFYNTHFGTISNSSHSIEELEVKARILSELKMVSIMFDSPEGLFYLELEHIEEIIGERIIKKILNELNNQNGSRCEECGEECSPWYSFCSPCYAVKQYGVMSVAS